MQPSHETSSVAFSGVALPEFGTCLVPHWSSSSKGPSYAVISQCVQVPRIVNALCQGHQPCPYLQDWNFRESVKIILGEEEHALGAGIDSRRVFLSGQHRKTAMMKICFAAASAAALMAAVSLANAQGAGTGSGSSGAATNQCWDVSSNMARDKSQTSSGMASSADKAGSSTTGTTGSATSGSGSSSTSSASARPAGMPNC